jgi:outer membrane biosynthesis protein TonB
MKEWLDKIDLLDKVAQARRDANETSPRTSNHHVEAAMFLAMLKAVDDFVGEGFKEVGDDMTAAISGDPQPAEKPPAEPPPPLPEPVVDEEPPPDQKATVHEFPALPGEYR